MFCLCVVSGLSAGLFSGTFTFARVSFAGIFGDDNPFFEAFTTFFRSLIVYQNIIPIALFISLEVTKTVQSYFINQDLEMFSEKNQQSVLPKSWNLCDDLGQIEYIFSDKTGTLTSNMMEFKRASINGVIYGQPIAGPTGTQSILSPTSTAYNPKEELKAMRDTLSQLFDNKYADAGFGFVDTNIARHLKEPGVQSGKIREFFTLLALCHTVLVENDDQKHEINYKAQSPDEAALVSAAKNMGFACLNRTDNKVEIDVMGEVRTYTVLNIIEFNSDRKRMSVIVKRPEGDIFLFCKGADSVIYERLSPNLGANFTEVTSQHMETFANEGLRTLCLTYRSITADEYQDWSKKYNAAQASLEDRDAKCDQVANLIEKDLILMGASAIEDKLQEGVPDTLSMLGSAGIKLWVLTGDKVETAINIGFSCNLLKKSMILIAIQSLSLTETKVQLKEALLRFWDHRGNPKETGGYALVIDGNSLKFALSDELKGLLLELGCRCHSVLCCRVSPLQKAMVVRLVRRGLVSNFN